MSVLFLWPIGVKKAQDAPIATPIRYESGLTLRRCAISTATGAAIIAVATLFITSESVMVTMISKTKISTGENNSDKPTKLDAINAVPPVASKALPIGIIEPKRTITGHSMDS